jgi:cytochrome c oxidase accessory protein FixG
VPGLRVLQADERVLSTLNLDGSRRWLRPRLSPGSWWRARRAVAYALMVLFFILPYLRIGGRPPILLDLPRREFTVFGTTFMPTETLLFMLGFVALGILIFLVTALFGRVWCGWACPQTVYMEYLFRPLERLLEGGPRGGQRLDTLGVRGHLHPRRLLKLGVYGVLALFLAHTFLAYFVGVEQLAVWVRRSPVEHPTSFFVMLGTTAAIFLDFAWFREQTCLVACPYGRLQSVLLDRRSLIVGYDHRRGEPRARAARRDERSGDCVDCLLCVQTCPTGIDIRDGLQMECIHCTQCMDACDAVMARIGKPPGLIRYGSRDGFEGVTRGWLRARVVLYPLALALALGLFVWQLGTRAAAELTVLRATDAPYTLQADGTVLNAIKIRVANRAGEERAYRLALEGPEGLTLVAPINPLPVRPGGRRNETVFVRAPATAFAEGVREVTFTIDDGRGTRLAAPYRLVGPATGGGR